MSVFEERLSFSMFYFMKNDHETIVKSMCGRRMGWGRQCKLCSWLRVEPWWGLRAKKNKKKKKKEERYWLLTSGGHINGWKKKKPTKIIYSEWKKKKKKFDINMFINALKPNFMKIKFENSIRRLSFLCRLQDIKIAWINPCPENVRKPLVFSRFKEV